MMTAVPITSPNAFYEAALGYTDYLIKTRTFYEAAAFC